MVRYFYAQIYSNTQLLSNRVNTIISLPDGSTTNDARLEDICNGYNNTTVYTSPGDAVRTQISDVYDFIDDYIDGKYNKDFVFAIGLHCKLNVTNYYIPFSIYFFKIGGL